MEEKDGTKAKVRAKRMDTTLALIAANAAGLNVTERNRCITTLFSPARGMRILQDASLRLNIDTRDLKQEGASRA